MSIEGEIYKLTEKAIKRYSDKSKSDQYEKDIFKVTDSGKLAFTVSKADEDNNIIAVCVSGVNYEAGVNFCADNWAVFLACEIGDTIEKIGDAEESDYWVITIPNSQNSNQNPRRFTNPSIFALGPYTEKYATEKAKSQIRGGAEGVKVFVVKEIAEAKLETVMVKK